MLILKDSNIFKIENNNINKRSLVTNINSTDLTYLNIFNNYSKIKDFKHFYYKYNLLIEYFEENLLFNCCFNSFYCKFSNIKIIQGNKYKIDKFLTFLKNNLIGENKYIIFERSFAFVDFDKYINNYKRIQNKYKNQNYKSYIDKENNEKIIINYNDLTDLELADFVRTY